MRRRTEKGINPLEGSKVLPLLSYPVLEAPPSTGLATYFTDWLEHSNYDHYWKAISIEDHYADIQVPVFGVGAWYDIFLGGTLRNYVRLKTEAGTGAARKGQRLEVTVGGHAGGGRKIGAVDFGEKLPADDEAAMLRWYDWLLKGEGNGVEKEKPVKIFVMGKNEWREEDDWPLERAKSTRYYLHSAGAANGLSGNGVLNTAGTGGGKGGPFIFVASEVVATIAAPLRRPAVRAGTWPPC